MSDRHINMRFGCTYAGEENSIAGLEVEHQIEGEWQPLELAVTSPGFDIFVYSLLHCQHTYFRLNCAERGLFLASATGSIRVTTDEDWNMFEMQVQMAGQLVSGTASQDDIDYIVGRMRQCPASRNIREPAATHTTISLDS